MGKRKRSNQGKAEGGSPNTLNGEPKADNPPKRVSSSTVIKAGLGRKHASGKAAARRSDKATSFQGGKLGAKKPFAWTTTQEIIALAELFKSTDVDAGQPFDTSSLDWEQLAATVGQRLDHNLTRTQIYEKARRLKERYVRMHKQVDKGQPNAFKNEDEESVYKLSHQIWGSSEEEPCQKKSSDVDTIHKGSIVSDVAEVEIPEVTMEKEPVPKTLTRSPSEPPIEPKEGMSAVYTHTNPDPTLNSESKINATIEGDTQKTLEFFQAEQQALLRQLEKSCATVLQDMQEKFLSMMNNTVRGSQFAWMGGGGGCVPSYDCTQTPLSWDKFVNKCLSTITSTEKTSAFESLRERWQQQRLQELKLTSMKLQLMLEDCKIEQEKLERQVSKQPEKS